MSTHERISALRLIFTALCLTSMLLSPLRIVECQSDEEELRSLVGEAYIRVRLAEEAGGDVSRLVQRLNEALEAIDEGGFERAETLISEVVEEAHGVEMEGLRAGRWSLIKTGLLVASLGVLGVLVWVYGPRLFWSLWLRLKGDWRIESG